MQGPEIEEYQDSPILIGIPPKIWKDLEDVMQDHEITRDSDVGDFASIICRNAILDYVERQKKKRERDKIPVRRSDDEYCCGECAHTITCCTCAQDAEDEWERERSLEPDHNE